MRRRAIALIALFPVVAPVAAYALATLGPSPASVEFARRCVRTASAGETVTATNAGDEDALNVEVSISPSTHAGIFPLSGKTAWPSLGPGEAISFKVRFQPEAEPSTSARAVIFYDSVVPPKKTKPPSASPSASPSESPEPTPTPSPSTTPKKTSVPLTGSGIDRFVATSPLVLGFDALRVGRAAEPQRLQMLDDGGTALQVSRVSLGGRDARDFTIDATGPFTITEGKPVSIRVGFKPRGVGGRIAEIVIESNSCEDQTLRVPIAGIGVLPDIITLPQRVDFGSAKPGQGKKDILQVVNQGGLRLDVSGMEISGVDADLFELDRQPTYPKRLQPGESFDARVLFRPVDPGPVSATVEITSNDPDTPTWKVPLLATVRELPPSPTPTPTVTAAPPPPPEDRGFSIPFGQFLPEMAVGVAVVGFFVFLALLRRMRGIPD